MTEDGMVGWHQQLNGHEFEETLGVGYGQGGLVCCSPWGHKESNTTERLNKFGCVPVLMRWMKLEPIIQSEVSQKEKHQYSILMHIYGI